MAANMSLFGCKQTMPTETPTIKTFEVIPTGDIYLETTTNNTKSQRITIHNLLLDTLTVSYTVIWKKGEGIGFGAPGPSILLNANATDTALIFLFSPRLPGNDTAFLTIRSSRGDSVSKMIVGHATGEPYDYTNLLMTLVMENLSFHDSITKVTNGATTDTSYNINGHNSDTSSYRASTSYRTPESIVFSYFNRNDQLNDTETSNDDFMISLDIFLDTVAHKVKTLNYSSEHTTYYQRHIASAHDSQSDYKYGFSLQNVDYVSTDSSFDVIADNLSQQLLSYYSEDTSSGHNYPNSSSYHMTQTIIPIYTNSQIHIHLKK